MPAPTTSPPLPQRRHAALMGLGVLSACCAATMPLIGTAPPPASEQVSRVLTAPVERGRLDVIVEQRGTLNSANDTVAVNQCEWSTTLLSLAPEGQWVEEGEVVAVLDSSEIEERLHEREVTLIQAQAALSEARESLRMQRLENDSGLAQAELAKTLADLDLSKYVNGEYEKAHKEAQNAVALAEEDFSGAQKRYEYIQRRARKGYENEMAVTRERLTVMKYRNAVQTAEGQLAVLEKYTYPRQLTELQAQAVEAGRELERAERLASVALLNREIRVRSYEMRLEAIQAYVDRLQQSIEACTIRAPQSGELVYADSRSSSSRIEEGARVRFQQPIVRIPDFTQMQVDLRIHETRIHGVRDGLPVRIRVDALSGREFHGRVESVSRLPVRGRYPNYDLREYEVVVRVEADPSELRDLKPGLTAQAVIHIDQVEDCLQVPMQSVVDVAGHPIVFVETPEGIEHRELELGQSNVTHVEVRRGLSEGDSVLLGPRTVCSDQLFALQRRFNEEVDPINIGG